MDAASSVVSSQVDLHARFGGVVPEIASRAHVDLLTPVIAGLTLVVGFVVAQGAGSPRLGGAVLVAVVGLTGVLVNETPAKQEVDQIITVNADFGEGRVETWIDPGTPGRNDVHAIIVGADGAPDDYDEVGFALALPAQDVGPLNLEPVRIGPGHYQLVGADLSIRGDWTLTVSARPDRFTQTEATVSFTID